MSLSHGILGFLSYQEMSGYDLTKAFQSSVNFFWHAQNSHIYLELGKLSKNQLVSMREVPQTERPSKKVYTITALGKQELFRWLSTDLAENKQSGKNAFMMQVFFSGNRSTAESIHMLQKFAEDCKQALKEMAAVPQSIDDYGRLVEPHNMLYWQFTADFGRSYFHMSIEWANRCIAKLEGLQ